jgi:hypothetical protein
LRGNEVRKKGFRGESARGKTGRHVVSGGVWRYESEFPVDGATDFCESATMANKSASVHHQPERGIRKKG